MLVPNGVLSLEILSAPHPFTRQSRWKDTEQRKLEACIGAIVRQLYLVAVAIKSDRDEADRRHRAWEEEQRRHAEAARREEEERARREWLHRLIERWRLARDIREFVAGATKALENSHDTEVKPVLTKETLSWALSYATKLDPLSTILPDGNPKTTSTNPASSEGGASPNRGEQEPGEAGGEE